MGSDRGDLQVVPRTRNPPVSSGETPCTFPLPAPHETHLTDTSLPPEYWSGPTHTPESRTRSGVL